MEENAKLIASGPNTTSTTKRVVSVVCILAFYFVIVMQVSLPNAFLPVELVEVRGVKVVVNGVAVAALPFTSSISSFFSTELTDKLSLSFKRSLVLTGVISFLPTLVFALPITNDALFICLITLVRLLQGFVEGIIEPQIQGVIYATFPERMGLMVAISQMIWGVGIGAGAAVGTALYSVGSIGIPFIVSSALILVLSVANYFYPHPSLLERGNDNFEERENTNCKDLAISSPIFGQNHSDNENECEVEHDHGPAERECLDEKRSTSSSPLNRCQDSNSTTLIVSAIVKILESPVFCLGIVLSTAIGIINAYYECFLSLYFVQVYARPVSEGGLTILGANLVYGVAVIVTGFLNDKGLSRMITIVVGSVVMGISTVLFAPSILGFHWNSILVPAILVTIPFFIALAMCCVSVVPLLIFHDTEPDYIKSSQKASGIFMSMYLVGYTLCPLIIGALLDVSSFSVSSLVVAGINFVSLGYVLGIHFKSGNLLTIINTMP